MDKSYSYRKAIAAACGLDVDCGACTDGSGAVASKPVIAAGGIAYGRGFAVALAFGADGELVGTRFLACQEAGLTQAHKQAILESDGHDTLLTEIPDLASGHVWLGAMSGVRGNRFVERWAVRDWALRQDPSAAAARQAGDPDEAPLFIG